MRIKAFLTLFLGFVFFIAPHFSSAQQQTQTQQEQLALYYFNNGEFDKAVGLYEKLFDKYPSVSIYYTNYYKTLLQLKQYDDAAKVVKKQMKKNAQDLTCYVDLGYAQQQAGKLKDANESYEDAIKKIYPDPNMIVRLGNAFVSVEKYDEALKTYTDGRNILGDPSLFINELSSIYIAQGNAAGLINLYLNLLEINPGLLTQVESHLQDLMQQKTYQQEIETQLYKLIQKYPEKTMYGDLLTWYFIQQKDFDDAYIQVKAIDKRNNEDGNRIFQFAQSAFAEGSYQAATDAFQYIIDNKGKGSSYYMPSRTQQLNVLKTRLAVDNNLPATFLTDLEKKYQDFLSEFGRNSNTIKVVQDYASLEARYMDKLDTAIDVLSNIITTPGSTKKAIAECKLDLGDDYLLSGNVWDSQLLYTQVDKDFVDEPIGEDARFRNAKLSYYKGEFEWTQAQLNILKGATSEMISNDAIALSVFITDNSGLDSITTPLEMYARADLFLFRHKYGDALNTLDSLKKEFPEHELMDDVLFEKGIIYLQKKDYDTAVNYFSQVDENYSTDLLADDALFKMADIYQNQLHNKDKAMDLYKSIITKYPGSLYVIEARKRFRALRGDSVN